MKTGTQREKSIELYSFIFVASVLIFLLSTATGIVYYWCLLTERAPPMFITYITDRVQIWIPVSVSLYFVFVTASGLRKFYKEKPSSELSSSENLEDCSKK